MAAASPWEDSAEQLLQLELTHDTDYDSSLPLSSAPASATRPSPWSRAQPQLQQHKSQPRWSSPTNQDLSPAHTADSKDNDDEGLETFSEDSNYGSEGGQTPGLDLSAAQEDTQRLRQDILRRIAALAKETAALQLENDDSEDEENENPTTRPLETTSRQQRPGHTTARRSTALAGAGGRRRLAPGAADHNHSTSSSASSCPEPCKYRNYYKDRLDYHKPVRPGAPGSGRPDGGRVTLQQKALPVRKTAGHIDRPAPSGPSFEAWAAAKDARRREEERRAQEKLEAAAAQRRKEEAHKRLLHERAEQAFALWKDEKLEAQKARQEEEEAKKRALEEARRVRHEVVARKAEERFSEWLADYHKRRTTEDAKAREKEKRAAALREQKMKQGQQAYEQWCRKIQSRPAAKPFVQPQPWRGVLDDDPRRQLDENERPKHFVGLPPRRRPTDAIMMPAEAWHDDEAEPSPPWLWRSRQQAEKLKTKYR